MKLELRLEDGKPVIFFTDDIDHGKLITCYSAIGQHSSASRSYMRGLPKPVKPTDMVLCWKLLGQYSQMF
jgi:hypothetical protein